MPLYSQDDGATFGWFSKDPKQPQLADFKENGRYCKSGLAYPASDNLAVCTSFTQMDYYDATTKKASKMEEIDGAYPCSPEDQANVCQLRFKIDA